MFNTLNLERVLVRGVVGSHITRRGINILAIRMGKGDVHPGETLVLSLYYYIMVVVVVIFYNYIRKIILSTSKSKTRRGIMRHHGIPSALLSQALRAEKTRDVTSWRTHFVQTRGAWHPLTQTSLPINRVNKAYKTGTWPALDSPLFFILFPKHLEVGTSNIVFFLTFCIQMN